MVRTRSAQRRHKRRGSRADTQRSTSASQWTGQAADGAEQSGRFRLLIRPICLIVPSFAVVLPIAALFLSVPLSLSAVLADSCSAYTSDCASCVANAGCGWCQWGQGSCMAGTQEGPSTQQCVGFQTGYWYWGSCTDECELACGRTCSASQTCVVTRDPGSAPTCTCETKAGVIAAIVLSACFACCCIMSLFVCIRRRRALAYSRAANFTTGVSVAPGPLGAPYAKLPGGQPAAVVYSAPVPTQTNQQW